jgi:hypothetical protein
MRKITLYVAALAAVAVAATQANAIVPPTPDVGRHPNVGIYVAEWKSPGVKDRVCTGTLVTPRIFLTAAHCDVRPELPADQVWVSFDDTYVPGTSTVYHGTYVSDPEFTWFKGPNGHSDPHDIAVIHLDEAPGLTPAALPTADLLSSIGLRDQLFTAVGYGRTRIDNTAGPNNIVDQTARNVAIQSFLSLQKSWLTMSANQATGNGGTCYGDSGGPHFLGDSNLLVSITITGDIPCVALEQTYRLDTDSARSFLASQGVLLP